MIDIIVHIVTDAFVHLHMQTYGRVPWAVFPKLVSCNTQMRVHNDSDIQQRERNENTDNVFTIPNSLFVNELGQLWWLPTCDLGHIPCYFCFFFSGQINEPPFPFNH